MIRRVIAMGVLVGSAALLVLTTGCGGVVANDQAAAVLAAPELDGLVAGWQALPGDGADEAGAPQTAAGRGRLSEEQQAQLRELEGQLDAGSLTPEQFAEKVDALLGAPPRGGRFAQRIRDRVVARLQLSEEQRAAAQEIYAGLRHDVRKLRIAALARARLVLTEAQREKLAALRAERFASLRAEGADQHGRPLARLRAFAGRLADALELTDEQRVQMKSIRQELREAVRASNAAAREQFRALLTAEQQQTLDQMRERARRWRANRADRGD